MYSFINKRELGLAGAPLFVFLGLNPKGDVFFFRDVVHRINKLPRVSEKQRGSALSSHDG